MKKGYLFSVLVHLIVFPLSCAYERNNPIDEGGPNFIPPKITIDENTSSVKDQDTIHLDSIMIVLIGNREQSIFSIKLDTGDWTIDWSPEGSFGVGGISEGNHILVINSMYKGGEMVVADTIRFHVQTKGFKPEFTKDMDTTIESFGGKKVTLVSTAEGKSPLQYTWLKGKKVLEGKKKDTLSFLSFSPIDTASYKCIATNEYGEDTGRTFILKYRPSTGGIKGIITDTAEKILRGAVVKLSPSDRQSTTGSDGKFEFSELSQNTYTLKITLKGYVEKSVDDIKVNDSDVVDLKGIELEWIDTTTYRVFYNGNGNDSGTAPVDTNKHTPGSKIAVSGIGNLIKTGHTFFKWNTKKEGTGDTVSPGDTFTVNANVTFYALWTVRQYTVSFKTEDKSSGSVPEPAKYNYRQTVTVPVKGSLEYAGYTFKGWKKGEKVYLANDTISMPASDVELLAQWEAMPTYTMTYDKNSADSGTVPVDNDTYYTGKYVTVAGNPGNLYRDGYSFVGWNTKPDGNGDTFNAGSKLSMPDSAITLFAKWTTNPTYSVIYHTEGSSGGSAPATATADSGTEVTIADSGSLYKTGYTFVEWNTLEDGKGKAYKAGDKVVLGVVNIELYGQWTKVQYTVTYHGNGNNGGSVPPVTKYIYGTEIEIEAPGSLQKTGHTFFKWNTDSLGNGVDYSPGAKITINGNMNFFARWKINEYTIVFNTHGGGTLGNQPVKYGDTVQTPAVPLKTSYSFDAWYKDSTYTEKWIFASDTVKANDTLHAKWVIKDIDGNIYTEVKIGNQVWMVENLRTSRFNNGDSIHFVTDSSVWGGTSSPSFCWYKNEVSNKQAYGALYNWHAVKIPAIAPKGWHVPSEAEWDTLISFLGGSNLAGGKMKEASTTYWQSPNGGATNESGFTALPGGSRGAIQGDYSNIGFVGNWWSSTGEGSMSAWNYYIYELDARIYKGSYIQNCGYSVRCVKD